ncbi:DUF2294 domain-containing protein [Myxacorys almedinensis]|uniref:DUF2294 family protein n=1 Tax=Myxacorys almedinensis A TaxID=2690445 RepID=A0A8J7Z3J3_9CYAN|nr:DUF2294 domain-containing protein [Myxacorys almedinensis]NDJ17536.1 DUF2294 family protein [Myxacorys almedinensis A]
MTSSPLPTRGQLERSLSQKVLALYRSSLGHQPSKVQCYISDGKVMIILEDSITKPEQVLVERGQEDLAEKVHDDLDEALCPELKALIEEIVGVPVIDVLSDAKFDTGRTGTIAVLEDAPQVRDSQPQRRSSKEVENTADGAEDADE